jgi:hypothetical protein
MRVLTDKKYLFSNIRYLLSVFRTLTPAFFLLFCLLFTPPVYTEEPVSKKHEDFFIAPLTEINGYGWDSIAYGGGITIGAGTGGAIGLNMLYAVDNENFVFMEMVFFFRAYLYGKNSYSGPYIQLGLGSVLYADTKPEITGYGNFSAGITAGWRFLLGKNFFLEPAVRVGYPYLAGAGVSLGVRR